ncbi:MAG: hypothetical protein JJU37_08020 [Balneolaceae bacterium]|nr:hypothetical protein [Balneolaceae bacterium]
MYRQYSFLLIFPLLLTISVLYLMNDRDQADSSVNAVIGDESYLHVFGDTPANDVPDRKRINVHLDYVDSVLRNRPVDHLTQRQKKNRTRYLDLLADYTAAGDFPHNDGHPDDRRPTFISDDGNICAVGYLVEKSLGRDIAEKVNESFKYSFIQEIDHPVFNKWVKDSGFTLEELAMIQPMYGPRIIEETKVNKNNISLSYGLGSSLAAGANILYLTNNASEPWLFDSPASSHWYGLAAGTGSVLLGVFNLNNSNSFVEPLQPDVSICFNGCSLREVTTTNHARTTVSAANIGVGMFSIVRAGYHLINNTGEDHTPSGLGVTQVQTVPFDPGSVVPALSYSVNF